MRPRSEFSSSQHDYWLGTDEDSGRHYAVVPLMIGSVDYDGFYELNDDQHSSFLADHTAALVFAEECRRHEHDDLLRFGWNRHSGNR